MYPNVNKNEMPSAPPTYSESIGTAPIGFITPTYPSYSYPPTYQPGLPSHTNANQPNQVVIVERKF